MSFSQALAKIKENEEIRAKSTPIAMVAPELKQHNEDTEITKTCAVLGCEESKNLNSDSFFRFPEDPSFRQIWTDLTGRNNWTPTDYSYICVQHFSVDCFECDADNTVVLNNKAVPSLKLPKHVLEVEYIDEESLDNEYGEDYDEENQDYDMNDEGDNSIEYEEEHLEEDDFSEEYNPQQQQPNQLQYQQTNEQPQNQKHLQQPIQLQHQQQNEQQQHKHNQLKQQQQSEQQYKQQQQNQLQHQQHKRNQQQIQQHNVSNNVQKDISNIQHLTNGTPNHATEKPTTSHVTDKEVKEKSNKMKEQENLELLKLFTEVQVMQRQVVGLKVKLRDSMRIHKRQKRCLARLKEEIDIKKNLLVQRRKKRTRILLSLQDKIREDTNGLVLAMPTRHTDDLKNFALSIYKYSPQAYIYIRNSLRTLLPSTDVLDSWITSGYEPTNVLTNSNMVRLVSELTDTELSCKVSLR